MRPGSQAVRSPSHNPSEVERCACGARRPALRFRPHTFPVRILGVAWHVGVPLLVFALSAAALLAALRSRGKSSGMSRDALLVPVDATLAVIGAPCRDRCPGR